MSQSELPLIRTKLAPPRVGQAPVNREALVQTLSAGRERKLTLVVGPAGCGKTTLLTQWRKELFLQGATVAWYNVSADDDDVHIGAYIYESFRQAGIAINEEALPLYARSGGKAWKPLVASLINDIQAHPHEVYFFIDDFHYVTSFSVLQLIDRWLKVAPANMHLVLGTRVRPPLALAQLQATDQITQLRFDELRFDIEETRRFVIAQGLTHLTQEQVHTLHDITDGWAAGLQLLAFSLRKQKVPQEWFERQGKLSLSQEEALTAYLEQAVIEHLSEEELDFLTRISACRRFNRELCEVLSGNPRAAEFLNKFETENLFLIPIETSDAEPWYRFHRLFAQFLNARLERYDETARRKLHQLAGHWFAGKNLHVEAMRHAQAGDDADFVVELIDRAARGMINGANFLQFLKWCESVPRERLRTRLNTLLCAAWAQLSCSRVEEFDRTVTDIESHPGLSRPELGIELQLLKAYRAMRVEDTAASIAIVEPMLNATPPANPFHALILFNIASMSFVQADEFERAREVARLRHRYEIPARPNYPKPLVDVVPGYSHLIEGNVHLAVSSLSPYLNEALRTTAFGADAAGMFLGYLLEAYYQAGEFTQARNILAQHSDLIEAMGSADGVLYAGRVRARLQFLDGQREAANETLKRIEEYGYRQQLDRVVAWSLYEQLRIALFAGNVAATTDLQRRMAALAVRYRDERHTSRGEIVFANLLARAIVAFDQLDDDACLTAIDIAADAARDHRRQLWIARLGMMRSLILLRSNQEAEAIETGYEAVKLACELGMMRTLSEFGQYAQPLIQLLLAKKPNAAIAEYLEATTLSISGPKDAPKTVVVVDKVQADLLSTREREVLDLLGKALSIKSIARGLDVSPGTVKWHLKNIYSKLGASSREDALSKMRAQGSS
ncbi:MAG: LuxR C-terminal-related transcriptional regulator [Pseudomonadota bacterium]